MSGLNDLEKKWLSILLAKDFWGRDVILRQLEQVTVTERDIRSSWCDIFLKTASQESFPFKSLVVPVTVDAFQADGNPITLLLYLRDGFVSALAVVDIAGQPLDYDNISFENLIYDINEL